MMNRSISPQDTELLSAYLDQELSKNQMALLEARLQTESDLKEFYNELRRTRQVLRSLPVMRAPRNFTLTPEMAGLKPRRENKLALWFNRFRLSSALAAVLLVLVLAGDFLTGITPLPAVKQLASDSLPAEALTVEEGALEMPENLQAYQAPAAGDAERAQTLPSEGLQAESELATEGDAEQAPAEPETTPVPQPPPRFPLGGMGGGLGGGEDAPPVQATPEPLLTPDQVRTVVRISEIGLAVAALSLALAAWLLHRRNT
jgi:hypothetical protein